MAFNRNKKKIKRLQINKISVNGAMHKVQENKKREAYARKKELERARQEKRDEIAEAVPWIGETVRKMVEDHEL